MSNTNGVPDIAAEIQSLMGHVQAPCILSSTFPVVPVSSLILAAFATHGFVKDGTQLIFVEQAAAPVTLSGADGQYWIALHRNTSAAVASWTRQPGTHYLWRSNPTKPANPSGGLILSQITVAGGIITAVSQSTIPTIPLSLQDGRSVLIVGGTASLTGPFTVANTSFLGGNVGVRTNFRADTGLTITYLKGGVQGILLSPTDSDAAGASAVNFLNFAGASVGTIQTNAVATAYNTSSDARLKEAIEALAGALEVILALRPVSFRWQADQSEGHGFLAHELQAVIPEAVTGDANAVNPDGSIKPQGVDHSKLVPWLVGAVQALTARVVALEAAQP